MPKAPLYSSEEIYERLKILQFRQNGKYLNYNDPVWKRATELLPGMSVEYVWLYITQNRNNVSVKIHGPIKQKNKKRKIVDDSNWSLQRIPKNLSGITKVIHLTAADWRKLGLTTKHFQDCREYEILEPGWTEKIYSCIWHHFKLSCPFAFKWPKITRGSEIFLNINGTCGECHNKIHIYSTEDATENGIDFYVSTCDTKHIKHFKKRRLRGDIRKVVVNEVNRKSTYMWRREKANELMEFGDNEPADLPKESTVRNAKYTEKMKDLNLKTSPHPMLAVEDLKCDPKYSGSIQEIALNKMYVMYWLPEQISLYKLFMEKDPLGSISIDATGSLIRSLPNNDNSKRVILYYQVIASYQKSSLPLLQLVSEKHDSNTLAYWLREWLRCEIEAPKQVVTDFSMALLNAASLAFNNISLKQYIDECYHNITNNMLINKKTILRIDVAHLFKFVSLWPCFNKKNGHQKDFYLRCLNLLRNSTGFEDFKNILTAVLTVAYSDYEENDERNVCYQHKNKLLDLMKSGSKNVPQFAADDLFADMTTIDEQFEMRVNKKDRKRGLTRPIEKDLINLKIKCNSNIQGKIPNDYVNKDFAERLLKLCKYFVLWTAIVPMLFFKNKSVDIVSIMTASSAVSEEYFKDMKNHIFGKAKNNSLVAFLKIHLDVLSGTMKLLAAIDNSKINRNKNNTTDSDQDSNEIATDISETQEDLYVEESENHQKLKTKHYLTSPDFNFLAKYDSPKSSCNIESETSKNQNQEIADNCTEPIDYSFKPKKSFPADIDQIDNIATNNENSAYNNILGDLSNILKTEAVDDFDNNEIDYEISVPELCTTHLETNENQSDFDVSEQNKQCINKETSQILSSCNYFTSTPNNSSNMLKNLFHYLNPTITNDYKDKNNIPASIEYNNNYGYLSLQDEWGGLLKNKKTSHYAKNEPDIENIHKRPQSRQKLALLINGNCLKPIKIKKELVKFTNTCPIDSVLHCLRVGYIDRYRYHHYVDHSDSEAFEIIKMISSRGINKKIYEKRADIILKFKAIEDGTVDCNSNVSNIINQILSNIPSLAIDLICSICKTESQIILPTVTPNLEPLFINGIQALQQSIQQYIDQYKRRCQQCGHRNIINWKPGDHMFIDIEVLNSNLHDERSTINNVKNISLLEIPTEINVLHNTYVLVGAIEHLIFGETGHYRPYLNL